MNRVKPRELIKGSEVPTADPDKRVLDIFCVHNLERKTLNLRALRPRVLTPTRSYSPAKSPSHLASRQWVHMFGSVLACRTTLGHYQP